MEAVFLLRDLLVLLLLPVLAISALLSLPLLVREPAAWQLRFFKAVAALAIAGFVLELLLRFLFNGGSAWLHSIYGLLTALILYAVSGLEPGGWLRRGLAQAPERIGPYFFWASFVGLLLWWRFIETGR
ncbi:hypothetical protein Mterra_03005 [Calidithermus terrae]|uniref:Uncharacterized protein n=1 Tax=Calidithermus terrae TaxID=1408545 RepID=A0A399EDV5_9DEIN|nr:hypothetical protein [Calidithermus terrae]RIH81723.1 hypothetical protein Mterra_03005 [Calidithermus terrae]